MTPSAHPWTEIVQNASSEGAHLHLVRQGARSLTDAVDRATRDAGRDLGFEDLKPTHGPLGEPIWPEGIAGSRSHGAGWGCAILARTNRGVGVDVEADVGRVFPKHEPLFLADGETVSGGFERHLRFCCKEAVYKACRAVASSEVALGLRDWTIVSESSGRFFAVPASGLERFAASGYWQRAAGVVVAIAFTD